MNGKNKVLKVDRAHEWQAKSAILIMGILLFETLTGLAIYLLPFSLSTQFMVLVHTGAGLIFIVPYTWYQIRHWLNYRRQTITHVKMTGYPLLLMMVICMVSGIVLTVQAVFLTRISNLWDTIHIISAVVFAVIGVWVASCGFIGFLYRPIGGMVRLLFVASGFALLVPGEAFALGYVINGIGFLISVLLVGRELMAHRNNRVATPASAG